MNHTAFFQTTLFCGLLMASSLSAMQDEAGTLNLDLDRVTRVTELGFGSSEFHFDGGGTASTFTWRAGELLQVDLQDGSSRFIDPREVALEREMLDQPLLPRDTRMIEIPPVGDVHLVVEELRLSALGQAWPALGRDEETVDCLPDADRSLWQLEQNDPAGFDLPVLLGEPVIFRDLRMVSLSLHPVIIDGNELKRVEELRLRVEYGQAAPSRESLLPVQSVSGNEKHLQSRPISRNMQRIYEGIVSNSGQFYDNVDHSIFPVYLITGSPTYLSNNGQYMAEFIKWKREKGFDVRVVPFDQIPGGAESITFGNLRNWVSEQYDDYAPEYLLLVGDDDGTAACPDSVVISSQGEFDVSDHFYSRQEGDDYFPEIFVGRFSVDNVQQLVSMAFKPVIHEKYPNQAGQGWRTHGLVVSCNYSDSGDPPVTPNLTSRWVIDKLRANGFTITSQDSIFYPPTPDGGSLISSALNQGRGIVSYRGWANSNGWIYPAYDRDDIDELGNVMRMPIVCSYVCQTGAFGAGSGDIEVEDPCFGEKWIRVGDISAPRGAVAFVGPSDLHTRSQYNNPVCSGMFNAFFDLNITSVGPSLLNGKMELWRGYPLERDDPFGSYFYFHVYNVLGDPDLKFWRHDALEMNLTVNTILRPGQNTLVIQADGADGPLNDVTVSLIAGANGEEMVARGLLQNGWLALEIDPDRVDELDGPFTLTCDHLDYAPGQVSLSKQSSGADLALDDLLIGEEAEDGQYVPGERLSFTLDLRNTGTENLPAGTVQLVSQDELPYSVDVATVNLPALDAGDSASSLEAIEIQLNGDLQDGAMIPLLFQFSCGGFEGYAQHRLYASNAALELRELSFRSGASHLSALSTDTLDIAVINIGDFDIGAVTVELQSDDERVSVIDGQFDTAGLISDGLDEATFSFVVLGGRGLFPGQQVTLDLVINEDGREVRRSFLLPTGELTSEDPLGPDAYGYYAIESEDYGVAGHPAFDWVELDPAYGGTGANRLYLTDDDVTQIELPFPLTFYGMTDTEISVCSNGWVSLGSTWMDNFRNWNLPSSLGPPNMICAYWDDLKPMYTASQDSVYVPVFWRHDEAEGRVVISWSRTYNRYAWENPGQPLQEFQIILYDQATRPTNTGDTEILVQFKDVTDLDQNNNFATCGLQNFGHNIGLQVSYARNASEGCLPLGGGHSILFTTETPVNDEELTVNLIYPLQNQWVTSTSPVFLWDHAGFSGLLGTDEISYQVIVSQSGNQLVDETVSGVGELDLADLGIALPENTGLTFELEASADGDSYAALQGAISFQVDATAPSITTGLVESALYPDHLELGMLSSEALSSLSVNVLDAAGNLLESLTLDEGNAALGDGRELYYGRAALDADFASLQISAIDLHGLHMENTLPLSAAPAGDEGLELPQLAGLDLAWRGGTGWTLVIAQSTIVAEERAALDLRLPAGSTDISLKLDAFAGEVLVRDTGSGYERVTQRFADASIHASGLVSGRYVLVSGDLAAEALPAEFRLVGNYPNPFNPETVIEFELPREDRVALEVYNLRGELVRVLFDDVKPAGAHKIVWNGTNDGAGLVASGVYITRLAWDGGQQIHKMLLVR